MNIVSQKEYRGINILLLWKASQGKFTSPYWLTYRQAESLGEYVTLCCGFKPRSFSGLEAMSYYSSIGEGRCPGVYA